MTGADNYPPDGEGRKSDEVSKGDYEVGYGRPPKHTRFRPGQSGNPKGRPKGSRNLKPLLEEELFKPVTIMENGKARRVPKTQAMMAQLVQKAITGDMRALDRILKIIGFDPGEEEGPSREDSPLSAGERAFLSALVGCQADADPGSPENDGSREETSGKGEHVDDA